MSERVFRKPPGCTNPAVPEKEITFALGPGGVRVVWPGLIYFDCITGQIVYSPKTHRREDTSLGCENCIFYDLQAFKNSLKSSK